MRSVRIHLLSSLLCGIVLCAPLSRADDTEVFFSRGAITTTNAPNVMFMFDTSGSMQSYDGGDYQRITRLKQAMLDLLESNDNINIGLGAFNGTYTGGAILYPMSHPGEDVCPSAACDHISLSARILEDDDDAQEEVDTSVNLNTDKLELSDKLVGLRFASLNIPRGATIKHANLEFNPFTTGNTATEITIAAQAIGNAPPFSAVSGNISGRTLTTTTTGWTLDDWNDLTVRKYSPDIGPVINSIVNRTDWCGGNAITLVLSDFGDREIQSHDNSSWAAPVLNVAYDPSTIDFSTTCTRVTETTQIASSTDDSTEDRTTGVVTLDSSSLTTGDGADESIIGLRFVDVDVPKDASISRATLRLRSALGSTAVDGVLDDISLTVVGEDTADAATFSTAVNDVSGRTPTTASKTWNNVKGRIVGERVESPDLSPIVQEIVSRADWTTGNALALQLNYNSGADKRDFFSVDDTAGLSATLMIQYRLEGSTSGGAIPQLRTARDELIDEIYSLNFNGGTLLVDAYFEAANYLLGEPVHWGRKRGQQDASLLEYEFNISHRDSWVGTGTVFTPPGCSEVNEHTVACIMEEITGDADYVAPTPSSCQMNQLVLLSDGDTFEGNSKDMIRTLTGDAACTSRTNAAEDCGVELATWLNALPEVATTPGRSRVITHTVGFNYANPFLADLAAAGGGSTSSADSARSLTGVFQAIVDNAADVNTTFTAPAASVDSSNRLTHNDEVYYGMFKPDINARWDGNLKRYSLGTDTTTGKTSILDNTAKSIFNTTDGGILSTAQSYWPDIGAGADGAEVAAGGAANKLSLPRDVYTYIDSGTTTQTLIDLHENTAALTNDVLGIAGATATEKDDLLKWARGVDILDADEDGDIAEVRREMGDPLHSSPFIFNYASGETRVFIGTNQGYLHAIDTDDGSEDFAFVPEALLKNLKHYYDNENIRSGRKYGLDGPIIGWFEDADNDLLVDTTENAYIMVGMRRGGRNYYVLNVKNPSAPTLAWTLEGGTGTDFAELGETWSTPIFTRMNVGGTDKAVLVFGGGYDPINDTRTTRDTSDSQGRAIFIVDASNGSLIKRIDDQSYSSMDYSFPSTPSVADVDLDGLADIIFIGDTGGQLWRFDINNFATGASGVTLTGGGVIGEFNDGTVPGNRRFYHRPDIALIQDDSGEQFLNVTIGSGWRAHPLDDTVEDRFYAVRQYAIHGPDRDTDGDPQYTLLGESNLFNATTALGSTDTSGKIDAGWYIALGTDGEKVMTRSLTVSGTIYFSTYIPNNSTIDACSVAVGSSRLYKVDPLYAGATENLNPDDDTVTPPPDFTLADRFRTLKTPGLPSSPSVYVSDQKPDSPVIGISDGLDETKAVESLQRTFWAEH